jgi:hypothetical protein
VAQAAEVLVVDLQQQQLMELPTLAVAAEEEMYQALVPMVVLG